MKRAILIAMTTLAALLPASAGAVQQPLTVLLTGDVEANTIAIALSPDGRSYVIDSVVPLEIGGSICTHPDGLENELVCEAKAIGGFEVSAGGGDDSVMVAAEVPIAVTLRGGPGDDRLVGGAGADKLIGGVGDDVLIGRGGDDSVFGGPGDDRLLGNAGNDLLHGDSGEDMLLGGSGRNHLVQ
jgi:RTX calcium-binding nonapeptide repeat (4 copies)